MMTAIESRHVKIAAADGSGAFEAFYAAPEGVGAAPSIVIVASIFGVNDDIIELAERYAGQGYATLAPDFFWRVLPGPLEADDTGRPLAYDRYARFDREAGLADLATSMAHVKALHPGKTGIVGFCFGGLYALLGATRLGADAAVSYHGTKIGEVLGEAPSLAVPAIFHFGSNDPAVPMEEVRAIQTALATTQAMVHVYEGAKHGFALERHAGYDPAASTLSHARSEPILETLRA